MKKGTILIGKILEKNDVSLVAPGKEEKERGGITGQTCYFRQGSVGGTSYESRAW